MLSIPSSSRVSTQVVLHLPEVSYFLTNPVGNHHIILPGHVARDLEAFLAQ